MLGPAPGHHPGAEERPPCDRRVDRATIAAPCARRRSSSSLRWVVPDVERHGRGRDRLLPDRAKVDRTARLVVYDLDNRESGRSCARRIGPADARRACRRRGATGWSSSIYDGPDRGRQSYGDLRDRPCPVGTEARGSIVARGSGGAAGRARPTRSRPRLRRRSRAACSRARSSPRARRSPRRPRATAQISPDAGAAPASWRSRRRRSTPVIR